MCLANKQLVGEFITPAIVRWVKSLTESMVGVYVGHLRTLRVVIPIIIYNLYKPKYTPIQGRHVNS